MKYHVRIACLTTTLLCTLASASPASAASLLPERALRLAPCPIAAPSAVAANADRRGPDLSLGAGGTSGSGGQPTPSGIIADDHALLGLFSLGPEQKPRFGDDDDSRGPRRRLSLPFRPDSQWAEKDYSIATLVPTACMAVGALTLVWGSKTFSTLSVSAKPWRAGGVLGIEGKF